MLSKAAAPENDADSGSGNTHCSANFRPGFTRVAHLFRCLNIPGWLLVLSIVFGWYSSHTKGFQHRLHGDTVVVCDGLQAPAIGSQFCAFVHWPLSCAHQVVMLVVARAHYLQILDRVVEAVTIFVVHMLASQQFSTQMLLHHVAMLENLFASAVDHHSDDPILHKSFEAPDVTPLVWSSNDAESEKLKRHYNVMVQLC